MRRWISAAAVLGTLGTLALGTAPVSAEDLGRGCSPLPKWRDLRDALVAARAAANGGLNLDMWGTIVNRDGIVCAVAFTGGDRHDQWPGSRVISAQKANTANAFSLPALALSTANLFTATQPGGSLYGLQHSNPVATEAAYGGNAARFGKSNDPMVGTRIGGVNVFGGGLALYDSNGELIGALGVSGDTSCADHNIAWRTRNGLGLDFVPNGVGAGGTDQIIFDITSQAGQMPGLSASGFGHPSCHNDNAVSESFVATLPATP
jgi:uncharacterized protein GlcG (DUF336 family)